MRILFVDDEIEHVDVVSRVVAEALDANVRVVSTVSDAVAALHSEPYDLVVMDIFIPLGESAGRVMGPRARRYAEDLQHLGGLVLLDELQRLTVCPKVLSHTACTDFELLELMKDVVTDRVPKPASVDVLLRAVLAALDLPVPG